MTAGAQEVRGGLREGRLVRSKGGRVGERMLVHGSDDRCAARGVVGEGGCWSTGAAAPSICWLTPTGLTNSSYVLSSLAKREA